MSRAAVAAVSLLLGIAIGVAVQATLEQRGVEAGSRSRGRGRSDAAQPLAESAAAADRGVASAGITSRTREEERSEASGEARGDARPAAGSTSPRPRAECELLVLDESGKTAESADVDVRWHDDPTSFEERLTWSPTNRRFSLPLGSITVIASRGPSLRSDERYVHRLQNEAPRTITLTLLPNCELIGCLHFAESEMPIWLRVDLYTMPHGELPELIELAASSSFQSGDRTAGSWIAAGATSFRIDRLEPGRRLLVARRSELVAAAQMVELVPGRNEVDVEIQPIPSDRLFELRITDSSGRPIQDLQFDLRCVEPDGNGGGSWGFDASTTQLQPDGTLRLCTTESMDRILRNSGAGRVTLTVGAPNFATESIPVGPGQRRFTVVLREERREALVVELRGASDSPYRELFYAQLRRYRDDGRPGWGAYGQHVAPNGIVVFDDVPPGRGMLVVSVRAASFLPLVPLLSCAVTIDSANRRVLIDVPPILELAVRVAGSWPDGIVRVTEEIASGADTHDRIDVKLPISSDGRANFRTLPARRYIVQCGDATTTIELERSSEITLAPKKVDPDR